MKNPDDVKGIADLAEIVFDMHAELIKIRHELERANAANFAAKGLRNGGVVK